MGERAVKRVGRWDRRALWKYTEKRKKSCENRGKKCAGCGQGSFREGRRKVEEEKWGLGRVWVKEEREYEKSQGRKWRKKEKKIKNKNKMKK